MTSADEREKLLERVTLRLDEPLLVRIERYAREIEAKAGIRVARSEVIRLLIVQALDGFEQAG